MERVCILVDGANFYHLVLKKLGVEEASFNLDGFVTYLANGRTICELGKRFYVGSVPEKEGDPRTKEAMAKQTSLFTVLKKASWEIKTSKLKRKLETVPIDGRVVDSQKLLKLGIKQIQFERLREKGVDVKLATDLIVGAFDNQYDTAIIISSDSDLVPAMDWVRKRCKKKVEYIGFSIPYANPKSGIDESTKPTNPMIHKSDIQRVLIESDIRPFIVVAEN